MTLQIKRRRFREPAGLYVLIPRGTIHAFVNAEAKPCKSLVILTPAGLEGYFAELGEIANAHRGGPPDRSALDALAVKYNLRVGLELPPQG